MSGWGSWLKTDATATDAQPNFTAVSDRPQNELFGRLEQKDMEWSTAGGIATETQTFYTMLSDGAFATSQIIHSSIGLWYPQVQITFKYFNPKTSQKVWKSVKIGNFLTPPPDSKGKTYDKRSCKGDNCTVLFDSNPDGSDTFTIDANLDEELQLSYSYTRPANAPGWKLGAGEAGGKSYFGSNRSSPDGYMYHRFWPRATSAGHIIYKGQAIDATGTGMYVHAIQGMRPNLTASRWNFANFQGKSSADGSPPVSAIMMEFTTTCDYGGPVGSRVKKDEATGNTVSKRDPTVVTIGSISVDGTLVAVTAATRGFEAPDDQPPQGSSTRVVHKNLVKDTETSYEMPQSIDFTWQGPLLSNGTPSGSEKVEAEMTADLSKGLVDKVDVLGEIPYVVRKMVNYVAGTKPYIYQHLNPATLKLSLPSKEPATVDGTLYSEVTFISEP